MENGDYKLETKWNERWEGSQRKERLTILGKQMFKAKNKVIKKVMRDLQVETVLEVGCGLGHTLEMFNRLGYDVTGIDISPAAVEVCRKKRLKAKLKNIDTMEERYDLVSSDGMLEHFLNFEPYVEHLINASKRYVLLIQPNHGSFVGKTLAYLAELIMGDKNVFEYNYRISDFIKVFALKKYKVINNEMIFLDVFRLLLFERS